MPFMWPAQVRFISSGLGDPRPYGPHEGVDIAPTSAEIKAGKLGVFAIAPGRVERVGYMAKGYGHYVVVRHPDGATSLYGHLSRIGVHEGQQVGAGAPLGIMGATGMATGVHLHLSVKDPQGRTVNPLSLDWGGASAKGMRSMTPGPGLRDSPPPQTLPRDAWKFLKKKFEESLRGWTTGMGPDRRPISAEEQIQRLKGMPKATLEEDIVKGAVGDAARDVVDYLTQDFWPRYGPDIVLGGGGILFIIIATNSLVRGGAG